MEPRTIRIAELLANEATLATLVLLPKKAAEKSHENALGARWSLPRAQNCTSVARASPVRGFGSRSWALNEAEKLSEIL